MAGRRQTTPVVAGPAKSGPSPDFLANQRSGHGVSSAATTPHQPIPAPATATAPPALDSVWPSPLPPGGRL
jgi:hypothetical protein